MELFNFFFFWSFHNSLIIWLKKKNAENDLNTNNNSHQPLKLLDFILQHLFDNTAATQLLVKRNN